MLRFALLVFFLASSAHAQTFLGKKVLDLTYPFNDKTIYWPTAEQTFEHEKVSWGKSEGGYWYTSANLATSEHGGTHLDAPIHFAQDRWTSDQVPIDRFMGPVFVIDIAASCANNPDYQLRVQDIEKWEAANGRIPRDAIVLVRTGWGKFWPDKKKYLGDDKPGDAGNLHFPGFSRDSATFLVKERNIKGVGIDTASLDPGNSKDFIAHRIFNEANVYGLENVAHLEKVPEKGAHLIALPVKIENGTGGPARIVALID